MVTISGGVILKQVGFTIIYKPKCNSCTNLEPSETTVTLTKGVTEISTYRCSNCGSNQIIKIKDVADKMKNASDTSVLIDTDSK